MIHFSGSLLPSHPGLPPFGTNITNIAMSESLCGTSMFSSERWGVGVNPMTAGNYKDYSCSSSYMPLNAISNKFCKLTFCTLPSILH